MIVCIRMENADDPRFALNADDLGSMDGAPAKSQDSLNCCIIPLLGSSDELTDGSAHPGGLVLQEATPIEGDGDSLKVNADGLGVIIIPVLWERVAKNEENLKIVSIVGFGGLGKTTLAKSQHRQLPPLLGSSYELSDGSAHHMPPLSRFFLFNRALLLQEATPIEGDGDSLKDPFKASRDSESTPIEGDGQAQPENDGESQRLSGLRKYILLLATLAATVTYQAGINPPGGFWSGTKSKHSRNRGSRESNMRKDVLRRSTCQTLIRRTQILPKAKADGASRDSESTPMASYRESKPDNLSGHRKMLLLLAILVATVTYQAGINPPGGLWSGTESEHSRIREKGELKDVVRTQTLLSCTLAIALLFTLLNLFKAIGIPPKAKETGASKDYESTSMGSYTEYDPENSSGSDSMVAKDNAVAESVATWQVGSASTHHATGNRALLSDFITVDDLNIQTGDGIIMLVSGRGSVITDTMVLHDVWFVPGLKKNVVSVSQLAELDCSIVFKSDACYISGATDGTIIGKALVGENGMFKLEFLKVPLVN